MSNNELSFDYPIMAATGPVYVLYPAASGGTWRAVEVVENGYLSPRPHPHAVDFDSFDECCEACLEQNKTNGYTEEMAIEVVRWSMNNAEQL